MRVSRPVSALLLLIVLAAQAAACTEYSRYLYWRAFHATDTEAVRAVAHGEWLLIALAQSLLVASAQPDGELAVIGEYAAQTTISDVAAVGNIAYLAVPGLGLQVIDIGIPSDPELLASLPTPGTPQRLTAGGGCLYLSAGAAGLVAYSLTDPAVPTPVDTLDTPGHARGLQASDGLLLLADDLWGLRAYSLAVPTAPVLLGAIDTAGAPTDVVRLGELALVADRLLGLQIVDIGDPAHPILVGQGEPGESWGVACRPGLALLSERAGGLRCYDVSAPGSPSSLARLDGLDECRGVLAHEDLVYLCSASGVATTRIDSMTTAPPMASAEGSALDLLATDGRLYAVEQTAQSARFLNVWDASTVGDLTLLGSTALGTTSWSYGTDLVVRDGWAYVASAAVYIVDVSNPAAPNHQATVYTGGAQAVAIEGSRLLVASPLGPHVWVGELTSPSVLEQRSWIPIEGTLESVAISGCLCYALCGNPPRILCFDVSDLEQPVLRGSLALPGIPQELVLDGALGFVSLGERGIGVLGFADPAKPALLGEIDLEGSASKMALQGSTLAVLQGDTGAWLADISMPSAPRRIGFIQSGLAASVAASPSCLYLGDRAGTDAAIRCFDSPCPDFTAIPEPHDPLAVRLDAFPNPARLGTSLTFTLTRSSLCEITVYDCQGRALRRLLSRDLPAGEHRLLWDGRDEQGRRQASGQYIARLTAGGRAGAAKFVLIH